MTELDRKQKAKLDKLQKAVADEESKRKAAIAEYNATVKVAYEKLCRLIGGSSHAQVEFDRFQTEIMDAMNEFVGESPDDWQDTEEGQAYLAWIDAWHEASAFTLDFKPPSELAAPEPPLSAIIAALPREPGKVEKDSDGPTNPRPTSYRPIDPKTAASVAASWMRIDRWLIQQDPLLMQKMGKGATPESIAAAEAALGVELPDAVRASYAIHDGSSIMSLFPSGDYLSLDGMFEQYKIWKELVEEGTFEDEVSEPEGPIQKVHYHLKWIPLTHNSGDHTLIDLAPGEGGKVGQLIDFSHETGPERVASSGLAEYLSVLAEGFESEAGSVSEEGGYIDWHQERGMARSAFSPAAKVSGTESSARRYFEFTEGTSKKFWEVFHEGSEMTTRYGKIGTDGRSTTKSYSTREKAAAETAKLIAKKVGEGYVEKKL